MGPEAHIAGGSRPGKEQVQKPWGRNVGPFPERPQTVSSWFLGECASLGLGPAMSPQCQPLPAPPGALGGEGLAGLPGTQGHGEGIW